MLILGGSTETAIWSFTETQQGVSCSRFAILDDEIEAHEGSVCGGALITPLARRRTFPLSN
jgi:hypothetical protein